ncbi:MAG: hypothetical protein OXU27_12885 [Candidatus Poribacteria bacterium]|nr:hypothetical protein [Candidatus Poribacteria bacterium]MDE0326920.1 hypothetical protein [Candidatus Poribacteria bacterium]
MNSNTIFTVKNEDLHLLDLNTAVEFFQKLLWAEARRLGIEVSKVNVSAWVNVPDGGVDATVDDVQITTGQGIIKQGKTSYQIKAGASFKPWQRSVIEAELFGEKTPERQNLGESILACLDAEGTYILVCTGIDLVDSQRRDALKHIENFLKGCGYSHPKVEVWSQNTLIGFLQTFPSLALSVNGRDGLDFQTYQSWSNNADMQVPFIAAEAQDELVEKIRSELREKVNAVHVRVLGEPGIGKTKLVFEATNTDDLAPLVIYCTPVEFRASGLRREILRDDNDFSAILIVDECDPTSRFDIWNELQNQGPQIKLITIYNDYDPVAGSDISELETSPLTDDQISTIIQGYGISKEQADLYLEFCDGSPRMAHHTGKILGDDPGNPSQLLTEDRLYKSFYDFGDTQEEVQQRELVLQYIALFKRFGFGGPVVADAQAIAKKAQEANPLITWSRFQQIVDNLKRRKILQGEFTLYITPKALHIKLWTEWWRIYRDSFDPEDFTQDFPPQSKLIEWFHEMFQYASESEPASRIVKELLGPDGPFRDGEYLKTRLGSRFFLALTEADPKAALKCLMRTIGTWDRDTFFQFTAGRRDVIWALEKIAMKRDLFVDAARLLLALGEAENEGWSNNASGVFAGLFSPGRGRVAPTEASPAERLPVLKEAFESGSKERRLLAVKACNQSLEFDHFSRVSGAEYRGLRNDIDFWEPKTYGELFDAYRQVWQLLLEQFEYLPKDEREEAMGILLERAPRIARHPNLSNMVVDTIQMFSEKTYVDNRLLVKAVVEFLHHNGKELPDDIRQRWEYLKDELIGSDFHSLMQRYVGTNLLVDTFDENENYFEEGHPQIHTLAQQAVEEPHLLQSELQWLVTAEAHNGHAFGYQLGKKDDGFVILPMLLEAQRNASENASAFFLGGYFRALFDSNVIAWEKQLDALVEDPRLNVLIPDLTYRSGITDQAGLRLLKLAEEGVMHISSFASFFDSRVTDNLSGEVFTKWITFLLDSSDSSAVPIALKLYYFYYVHGKQKFTLPHDLTFQLLVRPARFENLIPNRVNSMTGHYWTKIANVFLNLYPEKDLEFVERVIPHFGKKGTIFRTFNIKAFSVLTELAKRHPEQVWEHISKRLEERDFFLEKWLKEDDSIDLFSSAEEKGTLTFIPREGIWQWIDGDVENRAWYFAYRLVPKTLSAEEWQDSLARAFLVRYGQREDVRRNLHANYATEVWTGERSLHLESKKNKLLRIKEDEDNVNVKQWLNEFIDGLEEDIEHARIEEERKF